MARKVSKHRFLFNKEAVIRKASADLILHPDSDFRLGYLKGLCDATHGTQDAATARQIHVARQVIIAVQEE